MRVGQEITSCAYVSSGPRSITAAKVNANQEDTGYLAVTVAEYDTFQTTDTDNETNVPVPKVQLLDRLDPANTGGLTPTANDNYLRVYGAVVSINEATGRCGVITTGIVPFRSYDGGGSGSIGTGVTAPRTGDHASPVGYTTSGSSGDGRGTVIGYHTDSGIARLWVDLDAEQAKVS